MVARVSMVSCGVQGATPRPRRAPWWARAARRSPGRRSRARAGAYKVEIVHDGVAKTLDVNEDEYILQEALDAGIDLPHDCKLGVCMTCPAKLVSGSVDQSEGMLSDDVAEKGYVLLCVGKPQSDCKIETVSEEELLDEQLMT